MDNVAEFAGGLAGRWLTNGVFRFSYSYLEKNLKRSDDIGMIHMWGDTFGYGVQHYMIFAPMKYIVYHFTRMLETYLFWLHRHKVAMR